MLKGRVGGQDRVVGFNNSGRDLGRRIDGKLQLGLLAVVHGQPLAQEGSEAGAGTTSEGVEDQESLETGALISQLPDSVQDKVDDLLADGVVTTSVVVGCVLLTGDQLLGVEKLAVSSSPDLI